MEQEQLVNQIQLFDFSYDSELDFCPFEPLTKMRGLGNRIFYGEMAANTPDREAAAPPIKGPQR
jgi:hypothetical protein